MIFSKTTCPYCEKGQYPTRDDAQHAGGWRTKPNLLHNALHCHAGALLHTLRGRHLRLHALLAIGAHVPRYSVVIRHAHLHTRTATVTNVNNSRRLSE